MLVKNLKKVIIAFIVSLTVLYLNAVSLTPIMAEEKKIGLFQEDGRLEFLNSNGIALTTIAIEIAETLETQTIGLMGRTEMDDNKGMLFIFEKADLRVFWMRNTPLSLDIIYISEDKKVINIAKETRPFSDNLYYSQGLAQYVVEVVAGFTDRHKIEKGTHVRWQRK